MSTPDLSRKEEMRWWHWVLFAVILSPLAWMALQLHIQFVKWAVKQ